MEAHRSFITWTKAARPSSPALREGDTEFNGFYGHGIVDANATVTEDFEFPE